MPAHSHVLYSSAFAGTGGVYGTGPTAGYSMGSLSVPSTNPLSQPIRSPYYSTYYMSPGGATNSPGSGHSHSFSVNVGISANPGSLNLNVKYVAAIIAKRTKNTNWYNSPY
jgi:hypothetical protein